LEPEATVWLPAGTPAQAQAAVDLVGHRLIKVSRVDLK